MNRKGTSYIVPLFSLLFTGVLALTMAYILPSQYVSITQVIDHKEFENKAMILGNLLLSNHDLVYFDDPVYYRGVFEKDKLDEKMVQKSDFGNVEKLMECTQLCDSLKALPGSVGFVLISDAANSDEWYSILYPNGDRPDIERCFGQLSEAILEKIFDSNGLQECGYSSSTILTESFAASIRYSDDEIKVGRIRIVMVE